MWEVPGTWRSPPSLEDLSFRDEPSSWLQLPGPRPFLSSKMPQGWPLSETGLRAHLVWKSSSLRGSVLSDYRPQGSSQLRTQAGSFTAPHPWPRSPIPMQFHMLLPRSSFPAPCTPLAVPGPASCQLPCHVLPSLSLALSTYT